MNCSGVTVHLEDNPDEKVLVCIEQLLGDGIGYDTFTLRIMDVTFFMTRQQVVDAVFALKEAIWRGERNIAQAETGDTQAAPEASQ